MANTMWFSSQNRSKKAIFEALRKYFCQLFHELAKQKGCEIVEGHLMETVSNVAGFIKGKRAILIARKCRGKAKKCTGENFWVGGFFGFDGKAR